METQHTPAAVVPEEGCKDKKDDPLRVCDFVKHLNVDCSFVPAMGDEWRKKKGCGFSIIMENF